MTWEELLDRYKSYQVAAGLSPRTIHQRQSVILGLAKLSKSRPQLITAEDMIAYLNRPHARTGGPLSPGTKQTERSYIQCWSQWMVDQGYLAYDPAARLPKVKVPRRLARPINMIHVERLYESGIRQNTRDYITVLANTGLRIGEVVAIESKMYDWSTNTFSVIRKGGFRQTIYANPAVQEVAARRNEIGSQWWFPSEYSNSQFPKGDGHVLMKSASDTICRAMRRIGIADPRITTHSIRHFYACMLIARNSPIHIVQEVLGHASLSTTQLYLQVQEEAVISAVNNVPYIGDNMRSMAYA